MAAGGSGGAALAAAYREADRHAPGEEFGVTLPYTTVRDFVTVRRRAIAAEVGVPAEGYLTRHNVPGADAEVDFGEVWIDLGGERVKCFLFAFRLAYSGRSVHRISRSCGQQAFFEGHVHALTVLGGVPAGQVRYDNLTPAVRKVVFRSRLREENPKWTALREVFEDLEIVLDDRPDSLDRWCQKHFAFLAPDIRAELDTWIGLLHHGTSRRRPRARSTVVTLLRLVLPFLTEYGGKYATPAAGHAR